MLRWRLGSIWDVGVYILEQVSPSLFPHILLYRLHITSSSISQFFESKTRSNLKPNSQTSTQPSNHGTTHEIHPPRPPPHPLRTPLSIPRPPKPKFKFKSKSKPPRPRHLRSIKPQQPQVRSKLLHSSAVLLQESGREPDACVAVRPPCSYLFLLSPFPFLRFFGGVVGRDLGDCASLQIC